jgi:phosphate transport system protein
MRESFHVELEELDRDVARMGELVQQAVAQVTTALTEADVNLAQQVIEADDTVDALYLDLESRCYELLAIQQPVAKDLRLILAILRVIYDLERAGDLTKNIAGLVRREVKIVKLKPIAEIIGQLGVLSAELLGKSIKAFALKDVMLAASLDEMDNQIDSLYRKLIKELFRLEKESSLELAINMVLVGRYFERIADHAVNIAVWVNYLITGNLVG